MVEVNVAVTLRLACERALFGGAGIAKLLGRAAWCVCSDGLPSLTFKMLVLETLTRDFFCRKSRTKRSFWRLDACLLEEVSYEMCILETRRVTFGGSLAQKARFAVLAHDFWKKSRAKRSFWRCDS